MFGCLSQASPSFLPEAVKLTSRFTTDVECPPRCQNHQILTGESSPFSTLGRLFEQAPGLTALSASGRLEHAAWEVTIGKPLWSRLSILDLGDMRTTLERMKTVCYKHKDTLIDLRLRNMSLDLENNIETWEDVGQEIGGFLQLRNLQLLGLNAGAYRAQTGSIGLESGTRQVGFLMMRWIPRQSIGEDREGPRRVTMWHM